MQQHAAVRLKPYLTLSDPPGIMGYVTVHSLSPAVGGGHNARPLISRFRKLEDHLPNWPIQLDVICLQGGWGGGTANAETAPAATNTAPADQPLGTANAETTPAGALAAAAEKTQRPDAACEGKNG